MIPKQKFGNTLLNFKYRYRYRGNIYFLPKRLAHWENNCIYRTHGTVPEEENFL